MQNSSKFNVLIWTFNIYYTDTDLNIFSLRDTEPGIPQDRRTLNCIGAFNSACSDSNCILKNQIK